MTELPKDMIFHYHSDDGITVKVDAIPLVRCGECKHHEYEEPGMVYCPKIVGAWVSENWYCADGEREGQE